MAKTLPRVPPNWITQQGLKAFNLGTKHKAAVDPRLPSGLRDGLHADLQSLSAKVAAPVTTRVKAKAATATQNASLASAYAVISAIGVAVSRKAASTAEARKAYGVGAKTRADSVASVVGRANAILDRAAAEPEEARSLGLLGSDFATLRNLIVKVEAADQKQERIISAKSLSTKARNAALKRIYAAIKEIAAAGVVANALNPTLRDEFDALDDLPKRPRTKKS